METEEERKRERERERERESVCVRVHGFACGTNFGRAIMTNCDCVDC